MRIIIDCAKTTIYDLLMAYTTVRMRAEIGRRIKADTVLYETKFGYYDVRSGQSGKW